MKKEIYVILDNIRSRENVGSIFRTADGAGVKKIFLCGITPIPRVENPKSEILNPKQIQNSKFQIQNSDKIAKTALGAENYVPWEYRRNTWQVITDLKKMGINVVALERFDKLTASKLKIKTHNIFTFKQKFPLALVLGNEVRGISPKILKYCDKKISIPMYGKKESLNVSVATGVALYILIDRD
ncbi:MAG: TrmH family RNA methyltransferase [Candidatus Taylorbacteria bacterium]|nr:TrmH family RNA methyltransferase [Candidatus Taylorbacteria bacterium]